MRRQLDEHIERTVTAEARLAAQLLGNMARPSPGNGKPWDSRTLDREADRIASLIGAQVTLVAADGRVLGDSAETSEAAATLENHASRPEIESATRTGFGRARRYSDQLRIDMLYVAVPVEHSAIAFVRVARPLSGIRLQLPTVLRTTTLALGAALAGSAVIAYLVSRRIGRRVAAIAGEARRYRQGDLTPSELDFGDDELGTV